MFLRGSSILTENNNDVFSTGNDKVVDVERAATEEVSPQRRNCRAGLGDGDRRLPIVLPHRDLVGLLPRMIACSGREGIRGGGVFGNEGGIE